MIACLGAEYFEQLRFHNDRRRNRFLFFQTARRSFRLRSGFGHLFWFDGDFGFAFTLGGLRGLGGFHFYR